MFAVKFWLGKGSNSRKRVREPWELLDVSLESAVDMIYQGRGVGASLFSNAAAVNDGATTDWIARNQGVIVADDIEVIIDGSVLNESALGAAICNSKELTKSFLSRMDVQTPRGRRVSSAADAIAAAAEIHGDVVVKPVGGGMGRGVTVGPANAEQIRQAYRLAAVGRSRGVLVEELIDTEVEYRCMATEDECVSVIERILPSVVGDGHNTVRQLIARKNEIRKRNPALHNLPIPLDTVVTQVLNQQGITLESVPAYGHRVLVRNVGGLSGGGEPIDRYEQVSEKVKILAHQAISAIPGLIWGGADIIIERHTGTPYVLEINTQAGYGAATFPIKGKARDIAAVAWRERRGIVRPDPPKSHDWYARPIQPHQGFAPLNRTPLLRNLPTVADHFFDWLEAHGYEVANSSGNVVEVKKGGDEKWFRSNAATASDLLAVHRVVYRHNLVRQLLARKRVPRSRGRLMGSVGEWSRFFRDREGKYIAVAKARPWRFGQIIENNGTEIDSLFSEKVPLVVQAYPFGTRVTVFATRTNPCVIIRSPQESELSTAELEAVGNVAMDAIRAVPELRWASVDLVVTDDGASTHSTLGGRSRRVLVEGMNINRPISGDEIVLHGSVDNVFNVILAGS